MPIRRHSHNHSAYTAAVDLRLLNTFVVLSQTGSVTAAAQILHVSQPALSRQLQQLERSVGVPLFIRERRQLVMTSAGRTFLTAAEQVLTDVQAARSLAASLATGGLALVRAAAPPTTLTDVLAPFLATLNEADPLITVEEAHYAAAVDGLRGRYDLALLTSPAPRTFESLKVASLPVWAHVSPRHPLAQRDRVTLEELANHRLLVLDPTARSRRLIDEGMVDAGHSAQEVLECQNPHVAQALAAAGRGVAVLSDDPRFDLKPLYIDAPRGPLILTLYAAWTGDHHASAQLGAIADRLREFCSRRYELVSGDVPTLER